MKHISKTDRKTGKYIKVSLFSVLAFLAISACLFGSLFYSDNVERTVVTVPNIEGLRVDEIIALGDFEFEENYIYSGDSQKGIILSQYPFPGSKKKTEEGKKLKIKINIGAGRERYEIPSFNGSDYREAAAVLRKNGCAVKIVSIYSDFGVSDVVESSSPKVGETVYAGDTVILYVTRVKTSGSVKVLNFSGRDIESAKELINNSGLSLGAIIEEYSSENNNNTVIRQSLIPGSFVKIGTVIDLVVCVKSEYEEYESIGEEDADESDSEAESNQETITEKEPGEIFIPWNNFPGIYNE